METRSISYYKIKKGISFNDGFELKPGTKVQFNFSEGQIFNVQIERHNEKRIFWVHSSELDFVNTIKERWSKKKIEDHNLDLNEKWIEYEKQKQIKKSERRNKSVAKKDPIRTTKRAKEKTPASIRKSKNKARVPAKTRKKGTKK